MPADQIIVLLNRLAGLSEDASSDAEWLAFVGQTLNLPGCYVPAARAVLQQGAWRRHMRPGDNTIGYIKTATYRVALRMDLAMDRYHSDEPRMLTRDQPVKQAKTDPDEDLKFDLRDNRKGLVPLPLAPDGNYQEQLDQLQGGSDSLFDQDLLANVPWWLRREDEPDTIDWEILAKHAAQKERMVPILARVLRLRYETGLSRARAMESASTKEDSREIENAWKWIDRSFQERIAPLFRLEREPEIRTRRRPNMHTASRRLFIPPGEALKAVAATQRAKSAVEFLTAGPSIALPPGTMLNRLLCSLAKEAGLLPGVDIQWNGSTMDLCAKNGSEVSFWAQTVQDAFQCLERWRTSRISRDEVDSDEEFEEELTWERDLKAALFRTDPPRSTSQKVFLDRRT